MTTVTTNKGRTLGLREMVGLSSPATPWVLKLFANDHVPVVGDVVADFTEVSGGGYASISLTASSWLPTTGNPAKISYPHQTFTFMGATSGTGKVYGYHVVDANNVVRFAERSVDVDGNPFTPAATLTYDVALSLSSRLDS